MDNVINNTHDHWGERYNEVIDMKINDETINLKDLNKILIAFCRLTQINYFKIKELEVSIVKRNREKKMLNIKEEMDDEDYSQEETEKFIKPIDDEFLSLPMRVINALLYEKILFVGELIQFTERELKKIPNLGKTGILDIKLALEAHNLYLKDEE